MSPEDREFLIEKLKEMLVAEVQPMKKAAPCATGKRPKKGTQRNDNRTPTLRRNKA